MTVAPREVYDELTLLGQSGVQAQKNLETFKSPVGINTVEFHSDECTSSCPVTGQPDFWSIDIRYSPKGKCLESKSLKLYLQTFRERAAFCEALAAEIRNDLERALNPYWLEVVIEQKPRGGIGLKAISMMETDF